MIESNFLAHNCGSIMEQNYAGFAGVLRLSILQFSVKINS